MNHSSLARSIRRLILVVALVSAPSPIDGQQPAAGANTSVPQPSPARDVSDVAAKIPAIPDVVVFDQENRELHFYRDLIQGKTVAINFIFTTCTTICPPLTANFAKVQKTLAASGDKGLSLISVSVDPENDTPERLKNYAALFHAQPGWTFVTGKRADLEQIWKAFNIRMSAKQDHPPTVAIGNEPQQRWIYASGLISSDKLVGTITPLLAERKQTSGSGAQAARGPAGNPR